MKIQFNNILGTIISLVQNSNTAIRTYTFQDRDGTIADDTDLAAKQNALGYTPLNPASNLSDVANAQTALSNISYVNKVRGATANRFHGPQQVFGVATVSAGTINVIRLNGWDLRFPVTIDRIQCELTTGTTGKIRLCIFADDGTGYPAALVVDSGELTITAPGVYTATINVALKPGFYHVGYITDTANTFRVYTAANLDNNYGIPATMGLTSFPQYSAAQAYGPLPGTFPASQSFVSGIFPMIIMRFV